MARFLAGLVCGALIVGAAWYGNRVGYAQAKLDIAEAAVLAGELREVGGTRSDDERGPQGIWVKQRTRMPRGFHRLDPGGPWEPAPAPWITPEERKQLVEKMGLK